MTNAFLNYQFLDYGFLVYQHYRYTKILILPWQMLNSTLDCPQKKDKRTPSTQCVKSSPKLLFVIMKDMEEEEVRRPRTLCASCHSTWSMTRWGSMRTWHVIWLSNFQFDPSSQVFAILWVWHCILMLAGLNRIVTRSIQLLSHKVRYFLMKMMMHR